MFVVYTARLNTLTPFAAFKTEEEAIKCAKSHEWQVIDCYGDKWQLTIREVNGCKPEYYGKERQGNNYYDD